ncbi:hypothetical protein glysoja_003951 [Glycine soja]|nr:hypothetical protein glysoja_003951 [Glycine soja]
MDAIFSGPDQQALCVFEERFGDYKERVNEWKDALLEVYGWTAMEYQNGYEKRFGKDSGKVHKWRSALSEIANLEGEHLRENQYQYEFIERIVEKAINIPSPCSNDSYEEESRVSKCTHWEIGSCVVS